MADVPMQNISVKADLSSLEAAARQFVSLMGQQKAAINDLIIKSAEFNAANEKGYAVVEQQISQNQKLVMTLKQTKDGWQVVTSAIKQTVTAQEAAKKAQEALVKAEEKAARDRAKAVKDYRRQIDADAASKLGNSIYDKSLGTADFFRIAEATLFKSALTSLINSLQTGVAKAREFQIEISLIRTVSQEAQISTQGWADSLTKVANKLGFELVDVAKAAYDAIQTQVVVGPQTFAFLESAGNLARTTGVDLKKSTDILAATIKGFKLSVLDADHTAAVLFKTVELGRIQLDELGSTFGKVAPTAGLLGVRAEEVGAAYATLTRQGIKTADASTLLINLFSKLVKPTDEMKKLLAGWGFESGQAAVKTLGFVEVLRRLEQQTQGDVGELATLFNELRGLRGAAGLTSAFGDYESDLKKIDDADKTYRKAIEIRAESSADRLTRFNNAARNTFIAAYGSEVVDIIGNFIDKLGAGDKVATLFANSILVVGGSITALKVSTLAYTAVKSRLIAAELAETRTAFATAQAQIAYNGAIAAGLPVQEAAIVQQIALNKAKAEYVPTANAANAATKAAVGQMALLSVAVVGAIGVYDALNQEIKENIRDMGTFNRIYEETHQISAESTKTIAQEDIEKFTKKVKDTFTAPLLLTSQLLKQINKEVEKDEEAIKNSSQKFGIAYKNYLDGAKNAVKELNKEVSKSRTEIERSQHALTKTKETVADVIRKTQFKYADDQQKTIIYQQEVQRLTNEAQALYNKGDDESVYRARDKIKDIINIIDEAKAHQVEMEKQALEDSLRGDPTAQGKQYLQVSTLDLQRSLNALIEFQRVNEEKIQKIQSKRIEDKKKEIDLEEERFRRLEVAVKNFTEFDVVKNGKVQDQYLTNGKLDTNKIQNELRARQMEIYKNLRPGENGEDVIKMVQSMLGRVIDIEKQANTLMTKDKVVQNQTALTKQRDDYIKHFKEIKEYEAKFSADVFSPQGIMDKLKQNGSALQDLTSQRFDNLTQFFSGPERATKIGNVKRYQAELKELQKSYQAAVDQLKNNAAVGPGGQLLPRPEDIDKVASKFFEIEIKARQIASEFKTNPKDNPDDFAVIRDGKAVRIGDVGSSTRKLLDQLTEGNRNVENKDNALRGIERQLDKFKTETVDPLLKAYPELKAQVEKEIAPTMNNFYGDLLDKNQQLIKSVQELQKEYGKLPKVDDTGKKVSANFDVNPGGLIGADQAEYLATGGYVHPGKAKGTDTIPVWLSPGEFVINAAQTRRFYTQLLDINRGVQPRYYARGGYVTTNVGDVHVHMESSTTPSASRIARQMGEELRREIRRGNVKLS